MFSKYSMPIFIILLTVLFIMYMSTMYLFESPSAQELDKTTQKVTCQLTIPVRVNMPVSKQALTNQIRASNSQLDHLEVTIKDTKKDVKTHTPKYHQIDINVRWTGSSFAIKSDELGTTYLTAFHVVDWKGVLDTVDEIVSRSNFNAHILKDKVTLQNDLIYNEYQPYSSSFKVLSYARHLDVAILHSNATNIPTLKIGNSSKLVMGDEVRAIGSPLGLQHTYSKGYVAKTHSIIAGRDFLQLDLSISPGNSGCMLVNDKGEVVGIIDALMPSRYGADPGLAIPIDDVKQWMQYNGFEYLLKDK